MFIVFLFKIAFFLFNCQSRVLLFYIILYICHINVIMEYLTQSRYCSKSIKYMLISKYANKQDQRNVDTESFLSGHYTFL